VEDDTGNRGRRFYGKPGLIMGCRADNDDDDRWK
jgi:hypothetical protein